MSKIMQLDVEDSGGHQVLVINQIVDGQSVSYNDRGLCISGVPRASPSLILQHSQKGVSKEAWKPVLQEVGVSKKRWWYSQLQHYGLESTHNVGVAKDRFLKAATTSDLLTVPPSLSQGEKEMVKAWQEADALSKRSRVEQGIGSGVDRPGIGVVGQQLCHAPEKATPGVLRGIDEESLNRRRQKRRQRNASNGDILEVENKKKTSTKRHLRQGECKRERAWCCKSILVRPSSSTDHSAIACFGP